MNTGDDELQVGEVIIRSPQDLKSHLVMTNGEGVDLGGFVCPYNILTRIQQRMKGEETLAEVVKHNKYVSILNTSEDEAITVYTFYIVSLGLFGGNRSTNSDIGPLPYYAK